MMQERAFLEHLDANPGDDLTRLVYADWLEDHGDPRSDYLRREIELARIETYEDHHDERERALGELRSALDPDWVARAGKRFDVVLFGYEPWVKIPIIKLYRELSRSGLKTSKDQIESLPGCLATALPRGQAEPLRERYRALRPGRIDIELLPTDYEAPQYSAYLSFISSRSPELAEASTVQREIAEAIERLRRLVSAAAHPMLTTEYHYAPVLLREAIDYPLASQIQATGRPHVQIVLRRSPPLRTYPSGLPGPYPQERGCRVVVESVHPSQRGFVEWVLRDLPNPEGLARSLDSLPLVLAESIVEREAIWMYQRFRGRALVSVVLTG